jgi:hypothetical protein
MKATCPFCKGVVSGRSERFALVFQVHMESMHPEMVKPMTVNDILAQLGSAFRIEDEEGA